MKKLGPKINHRVVIEPTTRRYYGFCSQEVIQKEVEEEVAKIIADVRRHIDNAGDVYSDFDQEATCEHCGYAWTEKSDKYNGGCCDKDEENNPQSANTAVLPSAFPGLDDAAKSLASLKVQP